LNIKSFSQNYINNIIDLLNKIDITIIEEIINTLEKIEKNKSKLYIIGNGGSSATASHMVNDLGVGLRRRNLLNINVISLADNTSVVSALANDIGYDNIFYMQMKDILDPNDVIISISCSGNSPNILKATTYAKNVGCTIIGLTGFNGGALKEISDINFHVNVPTGNYGFVEDLHMILDHIIYSYYLQK
jgi:D-sedoheptulose 7-phosphate isomerase